MLGDAKLASTFADRMLGNGFRIFFFKFNSLRGMKIHCYGCRKGNLRDRIQLSRCAEGEGEDKGADQRRSYDGGCR